MVDRIELGLFNELQQMRKFEADDAVRLEQHGKSGNEIVDIGNVSEDVVPADQIGSMPSAGQVLPKACSEEISAGKLSEA